MKLPIEIVPEGYLNTFVDNLPDDIYHADKTALNSSAFKKLFKSPAAFLAHYLYPQKTTEALNFGKFAHMSILESQRYEKEVCITPDFGDLRSTKNKLFKDQWMDSHPDVKHFLSEKDATTIAEMRNSVLKHKDAAAFIKGSKAEMAGYFRDPQTGIKCKIKPDLLNLNLKALIDLKTTQDSSKEDFSKEIFNYRYDIQMAFYAEGIRQITGSSIDHHIFISVEKTPPYECSVWSADEYMMQRAVQEVREKMELLLECIQKNKWPQSQKEIEAISMPVWAYK